MPPPISTVQRQPRRVRLGLLLLLSLLATGAALLVMQIASADTLPQPFTTNQAGTSAVECDPHGFEVDADLQVATVPTGPAPRTMCEGDDWSTEDGTAGSGQEAVFAASGTDLAADCTGNNPNVGNTIARNPSFPTSAFGCDDLALGNLKDCTTHTNGDKVTDGIYSIVQGGAQPKADIENFYGAQLTSAVTPTMVVGFERVTNNGDVHLNFALKQSGAIITPGECPTTASDRSSGWSVDDLIFNVNYGGGIVQPTVSVFAVTAVDGTTGVATLCLASGADPDGSIPACNPVVPVSALALTNCHVVQVQNKFVCGGSTESAEAHNSNIEAGFWRSTICEGTQDNPSGNSSGCRLTSSLETPMAPGNGGQPEGLRPQRTFIEVRVSSVLVDACFATLQIQSRASGESVTSALSDIGEAAFPGCGIAWEKRDESQTDTNGDHPLQGGATFEVGSDPPGSDGDGNGPFACLDANNIGTDDDNPFTVVDNGSDDANPVAGQIKLVGVCEGDYLVEEVTAPTGYALDDDPIRAVSVTGGDSNPVIGTQGVDDEGNTDESDFHNRLGSIAWEKRDESQTDTNDDHPLQGGATFSVSPNPYPGETGDLTGITDCVEAMASDCLGDDKDPDAGQFLIEGVLLGTYTVEETAAPSGYALDDDPTRSITVSVSELNPVIGTQGVDDEGNTDESDFHNRLGSIAWEKRDESQTDTNDDHPLQGGATFSVSPNPYPGETGDLTGITDCVEAMASDCLGDDKDPDAGQFLIEGVLLGTYTVEETVAPSGYALDDDPTRSVTVSASELNPVIGVQGDDDDGTDDEADFHNRLGSIAWEKRDESTSGHPLQGGATFSVSPNPYPGETGDLTGITDCVEAMASLCLGDDKDPDAGQFLIEGVLLGTYTVEETAAPSGWAIDDDPTRSITVSASELNPVIGVQGDDDDGTDDEADFHNRRGTLLFEKRAKDASVTDDPLFGGASFSITPDPLDGVGVLNITDNGTNDAFNSDGGRICIDGVIIGVEYTIAETDSNNTAYAKDETNRTFAVTASSACADRTADEPDVDPFFNTPLSEIEIIFRSLAGDGVTQLETPIVCALDSTGGEDVPDDDADSSGPSFDHATNDRDEVFTDLMPGTYVCTIVIDP